MMDRIVELELKIQADLNRLDQTLLVDRDKDLTDEQRQGRRRLAASWKQIQELRSAIQVQHQTG